MSNSFIKYLKYVGTGAKHNRDLSYEEMLDVMRQILDADASPEQAAAFLLGWRMKPETVEEFRAALEAIDEASIKSPVENGLELGYPFDGKADNPYIFPLAAEIVKPFGINIVVSGGALQPTKGGTTVRDVAEAVDLPENVRYMDRKDYCPKLANLSTMRNRLGLRTGLNTLERLPGIAECDTALIGVFHKPYVKKYIEIFGDRYKHLVIVKGNEGTPEVFGKCRVWFHKEGETREFVIDSAQMGVGYKKSFEPIEKHKSIGMLKSPSKELLHVASLNAALWLFAKGYTDSFEAAYEKVNG